MVHNTIKAPPVYGRVKRSEPEVLHLSGNPAAIPKKLWI
jgi:hypothetical protein